MEDLLFLYRGAGGDWRGERSDVSLEQIFDLRPGAEPDAVEISYLLRSIYVACKPSACVPPQMGFAHLGFPGSPPPYFAPPFFFSCTAGGGVFLLSPYANPGAKPSNKPEFPLWIFGCTSISCTGFFFDGRIPARQSLDRKSIDLLS